MELEAESSPFYPSIFFRNCEEDEKFALCSISDIKNPNLDVRTYNNLRGRKLHAYINGWFVLKDEEHQLSLWNPLTLEFIHLPRLYLKPEQEIDFCVITKSTFVLFEKNGKSFFFCEIRGYQEWTNIPIKEDFGEDLREIVICNGMIYGLATVSKLVKIDLSILDNPIVEVFDNCVPENWERPTSYYEFLIELCNELFLIRIYIGGLKSREVVGVQVLELDFSNMEWKKVESFEDKAFFMATGLAASGCTAIGEEIKGNHVYFTMPEDKSVYSFNMSDKTISVLLPRLSSPNSVYQPLLIMTESRNLYGENEKENNFDFGEIVKHSEIKEDVGGKGFDKLSLDMLFHIGKRIIFCDYVSFRFVNKNCRNACPYIKWTGAATEENQDYSDIPPWLTYWEKGDTICKCIDTMCGELYYMSIPENTLGDVTMCHSSSGWCFILKGKNSKFLWNLLTKETILLPNKEGNESADIIGCTLVSTVDSIMVFVLYNYKDCSWLEEVFFKDGEWFSENYDMTKFEVKVGVDNNMVYYDECLYLLDVEGNLIIFKRAGEEEEEGEGEGGGGGTDFQIIGSPSSCDKGYLIECDGKIMSIFVSYCGGNIEIFVLDSVKMVWVEVENLEDKTLYISRYSSFCRTPPKPEMGNRLYFPRFHGSGKKIVYYSLTSKKLHAHGSEEVLENFYDAKEQLFSCWVEVKRF